jgi:hypothetical protein
MTATPPFHAGTLIGDAMMARPTDEQTEALREILEQAWHLYNRLLMVAFALGGGMFIGREAAARGVVGGLEFGLAYTGKAVCVLSHAQLVHELTTAVEDAVLAAASDPPTHRQLGVLWIRAVRLCEECAQACLLAPPSQE